MSSESSFEKLPEEDLTLPRATIEKLISDCLSAATEKKTRENSTKKKHSKQNFEEKVNKEEISKEHSKSINKEEISIKKTYEHNKDQESVLNCKEMACLNIEQLKDTETTNEKCKLEDSKTPKETVSDIAEISKKKRRKKEKLQMTTETTKKYTMQKDVKEILMKSALEFIHLITAEANEICEKEGKKTITHEHVIYALEALGYSDYKKECIASHEDFSRLNQLRPGKSNKFKDSGLTIEELYEQQRVLFEKAKKAFDDIRDGTTEN
ncbi:hypothetical protein EDEG_00706 [Edhazardia aedis USNM 41457]|uniref:Transcription factor CBF/NF-Y/archaeal histone domain-containing protein n=1 Tax=Edhazardia aedis (strain USNM 41457) TaxID=1003232 RepID=J9DBY5_EDHAE|nr:hypothetical protein EDEG_00706 [Edhazardia aedis USNM 41457]|eukprot:EJW05241.1 hypothetical protein EDEG_00706 [Edhazardia aedis USNM 41457]